MISTDDLEYPREYRTLGNARRFSNVGLVHTSEHRHTVTAAQSLEALTNLHKADMERKRDAFMDHLKSKYQQQQQQLQHHSPHHTPPSPSPSHGSMSRSAERAAREAREQQQPNYWSFKQSRSPRHSQSTQSGLADQAAKLSFASAESLETMSEADVPIGFNRMNRFRQSLPLSRSASQNKLRSPDEFTGVLFLQYGDETRRVHITHELTSMDTLHALIVHMFPQKLTAGMLKSPNTAILIKDEARNVFYELEDVRDIQDRSIIKIYRKEPIYASYPAAPHLANGDLRREMVYSSRDSSPTRRLNTLPSSGSASSSPSRSRLSYSGGRPPAIAGSQHDQPRHPHHGSPSHGPNTGLTPSPSAILERRDVKPDEEVSAKNMALMKNESLYADPYSLMHEGRLSIASTQSLAAIGDPFSFPVTSGLYRRGSVRSLSTYSAAALQGELDDPLYKPGSSIYDTYSSATLGMGFRMPPSSPQKISELRDRDYSSTPRASPVRQSFRKDSSSSVFVDSPKSRPSSGSEPLCLTAGPGDSGRATPGFGSLSTQDGDTSRDHRLERMEAMEKQIASLTGLVQSVLTRAPDSDSTCGLLRLCMMAGCPPDQGTDFSRTLPFSSSEKTETNSDGSATGSHTPSAPLALMPPPPTNSLHVNSVARLQMKLHLHGLQQNATDLRKQLSQLRKMQLENQDSIRTLLKRTETELNVRVADALRKQEDPLQRQRLLVEEERLKYLNEEELIIQQLHDLEKSVEEIQKDSLVNHKLVTVQELEEKTALLRKLGETLSDLKNQFPGLQSKMRVVLRVEVEAVKFLKEEPHRLDALLKRCKTITDTLNAMRKQAKDGVWKKPEDFSNPKHNEDLRKFSDFDLPTSTPLAITDLSSGNSLCNWSPASSLSRSAHKDNHPPISHKGKALDELERRAAADKALSVEVRLAAERDWEEKRASLTQYSAQDINRLLEETQAELMKAIPDLDCLAAKQSKPSSNNSPVPISQSSHSLHNSQNSQHSQHSQSGSATLDHRSTKPQHKLTGREGGSRRGSDELTVPRYRTEKPSKSPPPPPPRRSFPSSPSPGLTSRSGEPLVPGKPVKKSESEENDGPKPHTKLRRTVSENPRPASTPPTLASDRDDRDNDKTTSELEGRRMSAVPQIVLTECSPIPLMDPAHSLDSYSKSSQRPTSAFKQSSTNAGDFVVPEKEEKQLVLLLTDSDVRVLTSLDMEELERPTKDSMHTIDISQRTTELSSQEVLGKLPCKVVFQKEKTAKDAYTRLHSLLVSTRPLPKPRTKSSACLSPLESLTEGLKRGGETGERFLQLKRNNGSSASTDAQNVCRTTYKRLDSLEETIRELENTLIEIGGHSTVTQLYYGSTAISDPGQTYSTETKKPPVPPKPTSLNHQASIQGANGTGAKLSHSSATSKLKHLQQNSTDKSKKRDEIQKVQQALGSHSSSATVDLSSVKSGVFSGRSATLPSLKGSPDGPVISPSQAKALLASLSSSGLTAEALLLSSTLRQHRSLLREQRASSLGLSSSSSPPSSSPSPTSATPSLSPSSPTASSLDHKPSSRLDRFDFSGRSGRETVTKDLSSGEK
uniref:Actin interacting protein 3-like C-terminal domain-containing protein n=1 Tax=Knipowitschia caucasica TaxID=637954 RepID=A0AAV2KK14_KNICA